MKQLTFIDHARIKVKGGHGGNGAKTFHREKFVNMGGPSGGTGGDGGSILFVADNNENTLLDFRGRTLYRAKHGENGGKQNMTGANGENMIIKVPVGTQFFDNKGNLLSDLSYHGQMWEAAKGGKGGRGNQSFKSSRNATPELHENGEVTEEIELELNLKILADVGLLGYPNAGKSTFVSVISNARPKIAPYPFTTLVPQLGMVSHNDIKFVVTDLPGLIEGASEGKGMGIQFLKHLSRTKIILHLIDGSDTEDVIVKYKTLRNEIANYSKELSQLPEIIGITKIDQIPEEIQEDIKAEFKKLKKTVLFFSSITKDGLKKVLDTLSTKVAKLREEETQQIEALMNEAKEDYVVIKFEHDEDPLTIEDEGMVYSISNKYSKYWANRIPLTSQENERRILAKFESKGILKALKDKGFKSGYYLKVKNSPFFIEYNE